MQTAMQSSLSRAFGTARPSRPTTRPAARRLAPVVAALDSAAVTAATQQAVAYVACVGAEAAFTGLSTPSSTPGRPAIVPTLGGIGGTLAAVVLLQQGGAASVAGSAVGFAAAATMLAIFAARVKDTPFNPEDWPGAKVWPVGMALISFFELAVFAQALLAATH